MRLLEIEARERPTDPITQFNLGWALANAGRREEAIVALNFSRLPMRGGTLDRLREGLLARCYYQTGMRREALEVVRDARSIYPDDVELLYTDAQLRAGMGDFGGAEACVRAVLAAGRERVTACVDCSVFGSAGFYLLGLVCALQAKHSEAEAASREATGLDPSVVPAWLVLADSLAEQGKLDEVRILAGNPKVPETARRVARGCDWDEAAELFSSATPTGDALLARASQWVARGSAAGSPPLRILDLMRA
jgi:tetratricopeptide (TPR) repeat protein